MTLSEHYKFHSRKSIKPYSKFFILVVLAITAAYTSSRFVNSAIGSTDFSIAEWSISINNEKITTSLNTLSNTMPLLNSDDGSTSLKSGDECYFDIEIDPTSTEVALTYSILIDLTAGNHPLPSGSKVLRYDLYVGENTTVTSTENFNTTTATINGDIDLTNNQALDSNAIRRYRIYCGIPDTANITDGEEFNVNPLITVSQDV